MVSIRYEKVNKGTMVELEPHKTAFIESSLKEKEFLESYISKYYPVLRKGSTILIKEGENEFYVNIKDTTPHDIIITVDTDLEVHFAQPIDYVEPPPPSPPTMVEHIKMPPRTFYSICRKRLSSWH